MGTFYDGKKLKAWLPELLKHMGLDPEDNTLMRCFSENHPDVNPSMTYKPKNIKDGGEYCKCHACGKIYNTFNLIGEIYNITDFKGQLKKANELFNNPELIKSADELIYSRKKDDLKIGIQTKYNKAPKVNINSLEYIEKCRDNLFDPIIGKEALNYLTNKRKISLEVIKGFNIGYDVNKQSIIIPTDPYDYNNFTIRKIAKGTAIKDRYKKNGEANIFNYEIFKSYCSFQNYKAKLESRGYTVNYDDWKRIYEKNSRYCFITEGELDALSLISHKIAALSIRSVSNIRKFLENLERDKNNPIITKQFYITFDNDEAGISASSELYNKMKEMNINVEIVQIPQEYKDINDFLCKDENKFIEFFGNIKENGINKLQNNSINIWDKKLSQEKMDNDLGR